MEGEDGTCHCGWRGGDCGVVVGWVVCGGDDGDEVEVGAEALWSWRGWWSWRLGLIVGV